jgi:uncharacterized membrane protein (UPF0127 family)
LDPPDLRTVRVLDSTRGSVVGERVRVADGIWTRLVGLLGSASLPPGAGLLLNPSQGVHTLGMRYAIDVVFLSPDFKVVALRERLKPFRMTSLISRAATVLELPAGTIGNCRIEVGDQLVFEPTGD